MTKQLLKVKEVSALIDVPEKTVYRWIMDGHLPGIKLGKKTVRVDKDVLERFLKDGGNRDDH
ncbi:MAG: helix-turn-helix domain-containing protein [Bacillota bacterium]|nr:helix-turn-helix domain-containing protein [Bacillota bacterium]MDW7677618.1 helix-turn-helix domain-containing protein [Bacillota bacterium]